ncbi:hypothetical protein PGTUg99_021452 [Puccinia graminis f. sp. tritici]|uniref:Uncharacterized protein n=1 Tax=Puccinia graminis f. sp. tritici TaxID=56615 RepID=A0A5B0R6G3_PUCGR|nr:hypothetical protein PGTUg99_021452 [Puccinia graminis f. sp. tritici]
MPTVLCEATQSEVPDERTLQIEAYNSKLSDPPRNARISFDYILFLQRRQLNRTIPRNVNWEKIGPNPLPPPLIIDIQSMTWPHFKALVLTHLASGCEDLCSFLMARNEADELSWLASINGHRHYADSCALRITGSLDFLKFASAAYKSYPDRVLFKVVMTDPKRRLPTIELTPAEEVGRCLDNIMAEILSGSAYSAGDVTIITDHEHPQRRMQLHQEQLIEWAEAIRCNEPGVDSITPPINADFVWNDGDSRKRVQLNPDDLALPPTKRNTKSANADSDEIEVVSPSRPKHTSNSTLHKLPMAPASPDLEAHDMETYLHVAHIPYDDKLTRARLLTHGITHWSFFRSSNEEELGQLGFPLGISRLLCEGVGRLERYHASLGSLPPLSPFE